MHVINLQGLMCAHNNYFLLCMERAIHKPNVTCLALVLTPSRTSMSTFDSLVLHEGTHG